jgi:hypothetical protein
MNHSEVHVRLFQRIDEMMRPFLSFDGTQEDFPAWATSRHMHIEYEVKLRNGSVGRAITVGIDVRKWRDAKTNELILDADIVGWRPPPSWRRK